MAILLPHVPHIQTKGIPDSYAQESITRCPSPQPHHRMESENLERELKLSFQPACRELVLCCQWRPSGKPGSTPTQHLPAEVIQGRFTKGLRHSLLPSSDHATHSGCQWRPLGEPEISLLPEVMLNHRRTTFNVNRAHVRKLGFHPYLTLTRQGIPLTGWCGAIEGQPQQKLNEIQSSIIYYKNIQDSTKRS